MYVLLQIPSTIHMLSNWQDSAVWPWPLTQWPWPLMQWPWPLTQSPWPLTQWPWPLTQWPWPLTQWPWPLMQWPWPLTQWPWKLHHFLSRRQCVDWITCVHRRPCRSGTLPCQHHHHHHCQTAACPSCHPTTPTTLLLLLLLLQHAHVDRLCVAGCIIQSINLHSACTSPVLAVHVRPPTLLSRYDSIDASSSGSGMA